LQVVDGDLGKTPNQVNEERAGRVEFAACRRSVALALQDLSQARRRPLGSPRLRIGPGYDTVLCANRAED
jgi:hypothetical protein